MAGSWRHMTSASGKFRGTRLLDNEGDCVEALEECFGMVHYLAATLAAGQPGTTAAEIIEVAQAGYKVGLAISPGVTKAAVEHNGLNPELYNTTERTTRVGIFDEVSRYASTGRLDPLGGTCRVCGCTTFSACVLPDGTTCHWVEADLCSRCAT